jgi:hypothetical protein
VVLRRFASKALIAATLCVGASHGSAGPEVQAGSVWARTRAMCPSILALIDEAADRSRAVRRLLKSIERTDLVVYVLEHDSPIRSGPVSSLSFVRTQGHDRYVAIRIDSERLSPDERVVWLAHELQHAIEVAKAPRVRDARALAELYGRIGWSHAVDRYETTAARAVAQRVRAELRR